MCLDTWRIKSLLVITDEPKHVLTKQATYILHSSRAPYPRQIPCPFHVMQNKGLHSLKCAPIIHQKTDMYTNQHPKTSKKTDGTEIVSGRTDVSEG